MQTPDHELDPRGDVLLTLRGPNLQKLVWGSSTSVNPADHQKAGDVSSFDELELESDSDDLALSTLKKQERQLSE